VSPVVFLVAFVVLSLLGALVLWWRDRAPRSMEAHMKAFERELDALSPDTPIGPPPRRRRTSSRPRTEGRRTG
jgi:hypothetical protein